MWRPGKGRAAGYDPEAYSVGQTFGKESRIRTKKSFVHLAKTGKRIQNRFFILVYTATRHHQSRLGITVSRKVGNAVTRNRIKRIIREHYRRNRHRISGTWDINCIAKPAAGHIQHQELVKNLEDVFCQMS